MAKGKKGKKAKQGKGAKTGEPNLPKALRNSKIVDNLVSSPLGRQILADALVAAATAFAAALAKHRPSGEQVAHAAEAVAETGAEAGSLAKDITRAAAVALADVVTDAARSILPASLGGEKKQEPDADARDDETPPVPVAAGVGEIAKEKNRDKARRH